MGLQHSMLFLPKEAEVISQHLAFGKSDGRLTFFDASGPIFACREDDEKAVRLAAALLTSPELNLATPSEIGRAVGRHRNRVHDYRKRYQEGGTEALEVQRRGPRGPSPGHTRRSARGPCRCRVNSPRPGWR